MERNEMTNRLIENSKKGDCEEIPLWDFSEDMQKELDKIDSNKDKEKPIKKGYEFYL